MLALKRVYDKTAPEDGVRFLVERLWPRGIKKTDLRLEDWLKDVAPSTALRRWFAHDPKKWIEFQKRYSAELDSHPEACEQIRSAARHGLVTLLYSSHDTEHNNAVALKEYLNVRIAGDALDVLFCGVICSGSIALTAVGSTNHSTKVRVEFSRHLHTAVQAVSDALDIARAAADDAETVKHLEAALRELRRTLSRI